jgi:DNA-binding IclR family transcriptional regulator
MSSDYQCVVLGFRIRGALGGSSRALSLRELSTTLELPLDQVRVSLRVLERHRLVTRHGAPEGCSLNGQGYYSLR